MFQIKFIILKLILQEKQEAQKMYKGKKVKQDNKPKTFVPGEAIEKQAAGAIAPTITSTGRQATKEEMEAIRVKFLSTCFFYQFS